VQSRKSIAQPRNHIEQQCSRCAREFSPSCPTLKKSSVTASQHLNRTERSSAACSPSRTTSASTLLAVRCSTSFRTNFATFRKQRAPYMCPSINHSRARCSENLLKGLNPYFIPSHLPSFIRRPPRDIGMPVAFDTRLLALVTPSATSGSTCAPTQTSAPWFRHSRRHVIAEF